MKKTLAALTLLVAISFAATAQQTGDQIAPKAKQSEFSLRWNMPYALVGTPFVGFEWKPVQKFGVLVNGAYGQWSFDDYNKRWKLWQVNPEVRYYFNHCWYAGASVERGYFNIKNSDKGREGNFSAGGLTGGYKTRLTRTLDLDFNVSFGYAEYHYYSYNRIDHQDLRNEYEERYWWGPYQAGIVLCWKICR